MKPARCPLCGGQGQIADMTFEINRQMGIDAPTPLSNVVPQGAVLTFTANGQSTHLALGLDLDTAYGMPDEVPQEEWNAS